MWAPSRQLLRFLLPLALLSGGAAPAALIQLKGAPLAGGRLQGSVTIPLERARDGDTPVLSFASRSGTVRLLLDTGATSSMVTPSLAGRMQLLSRPLAASDIELVGAGTSCGNLEPRRARMPPLFLRDPRSPALSGRASSVLRLEGLEVLVLPVAALPQGVDGVLGAPTLRQLPVLVNPRRALLGLGEEALKGPALPPGPPRQTVPLTWQQGVPLLRLTTARGSHPALADSGAEGFFLRPSLARSLEPVGPAEPVRLVGVCGEQAVERRRFRDLGLEGQPGAGQIREGIIVDNPVFAALGVEAIVGQEFLRDRPQRWRLDLPVPRLELW
jgi:hypothetical protein